MGLLFCGVRTTHKPTHDSAKNPSRQVGQSLSKSQMPQPFGSGFATEHKAPRHRYPSRLNGLNCPLANSSLPSAYSRIPMMRERFSRVSMDWSRSPSSLLRRLTPDQVSTDAWSGKHISIRLLRVNPKFPSLAADSADARQPPTCASKPRLAG